VTKSQSCVTNVSRRRWHRNSQQAVGIFLCVYVAILYLIILII